MKLHHTEYKKNYKKYILDTIETDNDDKPLKTDQEKIKYLFDRFYSEYGWHIKQVGKYQAMTNWLAGLAINIECYYGDIIKLAIKMGSIDENASEKIKDKVCDNYFPFMANVILGFEPKSE
tara:strand:+ start:538 stop:900 length:363 start_codon:yes stop_codon:yes gene_type:complete